MVEHASFAGQDQSPGSSESSPSVANDSITVRYQSSSQPVHSCVALGALHPRALVRLLRGRRALTLLHHREETTHDAQHPRGQANEYTPWVLGSDSAIAALHLLQALALVVLSVRRRELVFRSAMGAATCAHKRGRGLSRIAARCRSFVLSLDIFSIHSAHFDVTFPLLKMVNGGAKIFQAWKLSHLVPTIWVNRMYAMLLAASCLATPFLRYLPSNRTALHHIGCLAAEVVFDVVFLTIVPVAIFTPYVMVFDATYFINAVAENQHLFVLSLIDFLTKHITAVAVISSTQELASCVIRQAGSPTDAAPAPSSQQRLESGPTQGLCKSTPPSPRSMIFQRDIDVVFFLWGLGILIIHIHATAVANASTRANCYLNLRPWLEPSYRCAVLETNCEVLHHQGDHQNMTDALHGFDSSTLRALIITGCSALEMPPRIQDFPQLQMLKIYNSTITQWDDDAALTDTLHPTLMLLYIVQTNVTDPHTLPAGLLSDDFPSSLRDVEFCVTNLVSLPMPLKAK